MKTIKSKFILGAMLSVVAVGTVASIASTYAWYSYSTRSTVSYTGASVKSTGQLQIGIVNSDASINWKDLGDNLLMSDITTALDRDTANGELAANQLSPVTSGENSGKVTPTFKGQPIYQYTTLPAAEDDYYVDFQIKLRMVDIDGKEGTASQAYLASKFYLSDVYGAQVSTDTTHTDISSALRVWVGMDSSVANAGSDEGRIISPKASADGTTNVFGKLDLNGDGENDTAKKYEWDTSATELVYGEESKAQTYYQESSVISTFDTNGYLDQEGVVFGETDSSTAEDGVTLDVKIWLEGWSLLDNSAIWDASQYVGSQFNVGLEFQCDRID